MNFDFSDEQKMLREHARRFLDEAASFAQVRKILEAGRECDRELWAQAVDLGWAATAIAEDCGGLGLGPLELCVLSEELGRRVAPIPFFSTVCVCAELLKDLGVGRELLQRTASGQAIVSLACEEVGRDGFLVPAVAVVFDGTSVSGVKTHVADLSSATDLLVTARADDGEPVLLRVDASSVGVARERLDGIDALRPYGRLRLEAAPAVELARGARLLAALAKTLDRAAVFTAFEQIGGAEAALQMALDYTQQRYAFGRPLAGNQAVKHRLADMFVKIELARSNAYFGAWAIETDSLELTRAASAARISATEAFDFAAEENLHLHGGIGYTWESNCQFYYRRARVLAVNLGNYGMWSERLLASIPVVA